MLNGSVLFYMSTLRNSIRLISMPQFYVYREYQQTNSQIIYLAIPNKGIFRSR